jgi:DNA repair exonuclease SbcCD ATPase subunit
MNANIKLTAANVVLLIGIVALACFFIFREVKVGKRVEDLTEQIDSVKRVAVDYKNQADELGLVVDQKMLEAEVLEQEIEERDSELAELRQLKSVALQEAVIVKDGDFQGAIDNEYPPSKDDPVAELDSGQVKEILFVGSENRYLRQEINLLEAKVLDMSALGIVKENVINTQVEQIKALENATDAYEAALRTEEERYDTLRKRFTRTQRLNRVIQVAGVAVIVILIL